MMMMMTTTISIPYFHGIGNSAQLAEVYNSGTGHQGHGGQWDTLGQATRNGGFTGFTYGKLMEIYAFSGHLLWLSH